MAGSFEAGPTVGDFILDTPPQGSANPNGADNRRMVLTLVRAFGLCVALLLAGCTTAPERAAPARDGLWFVFLETGKPTPADREHVLVMQRRHLENFKRLFGEKILFAAGPLRDPSTLKRGIVIVKAPTRAALASHFEPDEYVRNGYMTLNAVPCIANRALATEGIDPNAIEEVRIALVMRAAGLSAAGAADQRARLRELVERGRFGAWYTLDSGPIAEILFSREKDEQALQAVLAELPAVKGGLPVSVWPQFLGKGVLR
jgi:uncharacterized protein YciI